MSDADEISWEVLNPASVDDLADPDTWAAVREVIDMCRGVALECASACLGDEELAICVQRCLDVGDVGAAASAVMTRRVPDPVVTRGLLEVCADACKVAHGLCVERQDENEACRMAAEITGRCEQSIRDLIGLVSERARES